jgi:hypothetical protein
MASRASNTLRNKSVYHGSWLKVDDPGGIYFEESISPKAETGRTSLPKKVPWYLDSSYILWGKRADGTPYHRSSKQRIRAAARQRKAISRVSAAMSQKSPQRKYTYDKVNPCSHFKLKLETRFYDSTSGSQIPNGRDWGPAEQRYVWFAMNDLNRLTTNVRSHYMSRCMSGNLPPANIQTLIQGNLPKPEEFFPPVNIITIIMELKESLLYLHQLKKVIDAFIKVSRSKANMLDAAANAYLFEVFGTLPMFSDIIRLLAMLNHLDDFLQSFGRDSRTVHIHRRFAVSEPEPFDYKSSDPQHIDYVNGSFSSRVFTSAKTTYNCLLPKGIFTLVYRELPVTNPLAYWKRLLGLDHIWSGIWDGLPFSWLIDYFINIGKVLESVVRPMYLPHEIVSACCSVKYEGTILYDEILDFAIGPNQSYKTVEHAQVLFDLKAYRRADITSLVEGLKDLATPKNLKLKIPKYGSQYLNMAAVYRMVTNK